MEILIVLIIIIGLLYGITWNKYYMPRQSEGKKTSFAGYIQWLKATYLHATDDEWKN